MLYIETESRDAAFHFSVEEYFIERPQLFSPIIMLWQTGKCVMIGNNQVAHAEVNLSYAQENEVQIVRRSSGGGAIFTDSGTLLYSMILPNPTSEYPTQKAREILAESVIGTLSKIGIHAGQEGRNDIIVNGKKVSGMAQYVRNNRVCSHCSLLYDSDLDMLAGILQVDEEKISSKAIRSVRSRVANLKDYLKKPTSTREFRNFIKQSLLADHDISEYTLTDNDLAGINSIYQEKYGNTQWTYGHSPKFSFHNSKRYASGRVEIFLDIVSGSISSCTIRGDFLSTVPIRALEERLEKKEFSFKTINETISGVNLYPYLGDITKDQLLSCMFD